jgi:hypothetical protein
MERKDQKNIKIHGKIIYNVQFGDSWSVVIMPDNILIDNYHSDKVHIHPDPLKHYKKIYVANNDLDTVYSVVHNHIDINKGLLLEDLIKELKE